jgi:hypothetical protein
VGATMLLSKIAIAMSAFAITGQTSPAGNLAPFDPVQGFAPQFVNFDDPHGKGFDWDKALPCGANRATVTVKFVRAYPAEKNLRLPVAKIWLHSGTPGDASEQFIAAVLKAPTDTYQLNALAWLEKVTVSASEGPGYAPADLSRPVLIDLAWTPDGVVTVNFGGEYSKHVTADKPITRIGISGSWAKFAFINLKVGHSGAPDPACNEHTIKNSQISALISDH